MIEWAMPARRATACPALLMRDPSEYGVAGCGIDIAEFAARAGGFVDIVIGWGFCHLGLRRAQNRIGQCFARQPSPFDTR